MRRATAILLFAFGTALSLHASDKAVLGSWEGDSKCTMPDSPCHDEHVLYQITEDKKDAFHMISKSGIERRPELLLRAAQS